MKILLLTESIAGTGHQKAAENVSHGILSIYPTAQITIDTSLQYVSPLLERLTSRLYMDTIRHAPPLWGWAYKKDQQWSRLGKNLLRKFISSRLSPYIQSQAPDMIVCTHAFCLGGLAELKKNLPRSFRLGASLTDYWVHPFWVYPEIDVYFVGAEAIKQKMVHEYRVEDHKIFVTGIPVGPSFTQRGKREEMRIKLGISPSTIHILICGGGLGLVPYQDILHGLSRVQATLSITVLTGNNNQAKENLESWLENHDFPHAVQVLDYVNNVNEWMSAADLLIGKPGGLTVSEALACGLPMLIYRPIPGQEERNSQFLLESGIALRADHPEELTRMAQQVCENKEFIQEMKQKVQLYSKPEAAREVGKVIIELME